MSFSLTHASHMDFSIFHYIIFMVIISFKIETSLQELKIKHDYTVIGYRVGSRYCTVCNSFNLSPYFNLKDINMTHHRATTPIRVTPLSPISLLFSPHPSASSNFKKTLPFSLLSDLSLELHGSISMAIASSHQFRWWFR